MAIHLQVLLGKERGRTEALNAGTYIVGRGNDCDLVLASDLVSRSHARLVVRATDIVVTDLESSNGTFVNGARIVGEGVVPPGDFLGVGDNVLRLYATDPPGLVPGAPGTIAGSLTEIPPSSVLRAIAVLKKTGILRLTSPPLTASIAFARGHIGEVMVDTRKTRDPIQALTAILRWKGTFELELVPVGDAHQSAALLGLDAVIAPIGSAARPSMFPKPPRPSKP